MDKRDEPIITQQGENRYLKIIQQVVRTDMPSTDQKKAKQGEKAVVAAAKG